jgi:hypothetical protein
MILSTKKRRGGLRKNTIASIVHSVRCVQKADAIYAGTEKSRSVKLKEG